DLPFSAGSDTKWPGGVQADRHTPSSSESWRRGARRERGGRLVGMKARQGGRTGGDSGAALGWFRDARRHRDHAVGDFTQEVKGEDAI
ncbi:MAG: hypothetical protein AAB403_06085, partial [Planctomycetota bacterium]